MSEEEEEKTIDDIIEESSPPEETVNSSSFQKRINKVTADKYREKNRADALAEENVKLKAAQDAKKVRSPRIDDADIDFDEGRLLDAKIAHGVSQRLEKIREAEEREKADAARKEADKSFADKIGSTGIKDYSEVIGVLLESVPLHDHIIDVIQEDDKGPELAYYLGKHLDVADRINAASPLSAARELGKISAKLSAGKLTKLTNAPDPLLTTGSGGSPSKKSSDTPSMEEVMGLD